MTTPKSKPPVSPAKAAANRANAQRSTGPRTPEGKARSCSNRYGRGFFVERVLVETFARREDPDEFATLHMRWHQTLRPETEIEADLVEKICVNQHQVQRLTELDGMLLEWYAAGRGMEGVAEWFKREGSRQAAIATLDRASQRWLRELARQQAARTGQTPRWKCALPAPENRFIVTEPAGFVSALPDPPPEEPEAGPSGNGRGEELSAERLAAMTDAEVHAELSKEVPLPPGYCYTKTGIVHENDPPKAPPAAASPAPAFPLPEAKAGEPPAAPDSAAPPPSAPRTPLKFRFPTPYPGQAPYPPLGAFDPVVRYPHLAVASGTAVASGSAVASGPGSLGTGNGAGLLPREEG